jgi:hypothetical protein
MSKVTVLKEQSPHHPGYIGAGLHTGLQVKGGRASKKLAAAGCTAYGRKGDCG